MANAFPRKFSASVLELGTQATTGVWTYKIASNILSFNKAAAATTSVVNFRVPKASKGEQIEFGPLATFAMNYSPTTADLTSAPTVIVNKLTYNTTTGAVTRAAVTQTLAFSGTDTVGKTAAGTYWATVTITTPTALADNEELIVSFTMNEAATSVLDIYGAQLTYN